MSNAKCFLCNCEKYIEIWPQLLCHSVKGIGTNLLCNLSLIMHGLESAEMVAC